MHTLAFPIVANVAVHNSTLICIYIFRAPIVFICIMFYVNKVMILYTFLDSRTITNLITFTLSVGVARIVNIGSGDRTEGQTTNDIDDNYIGYITSHIFFGSFNYHNQQNM